MREMKKPHVCTTGPKGCLGFQEAFGRRFYYCKRVKPIKVTMKPSKPSPAPRTTRPARCPRCRKGGYTQGKADDGRPRFTCSACGNTWTCGKDGGEFTLPGRP